MASLETITVGTLTLAVRKAGKPSSSCLVLLHGWPQTSLAWESVLDELGRLEVMQVLVEGGATVAGSFHRAGLVDRYVIYLAPALFGGDDARPVLAGPAAPTIDDLWRGEITSVTRLGPDLRVDLVPAHATAAS